MRSILRIQMIEEFLADAITSNEASLSLGVHRVTFYRLVDRYRRMGAKGVERHGLCGKRSNNAKSESLKETVIGLYKKVSSSSGCSVYSFYNAVKDSLPQKVSYPTVLKWTHAFLGKSSVTVSSRNVVKIPADTNSATLSEF